MRVKLVLMGRPEEMTVSKRHKLRSIVHRALDLSGFVRTAEGYEARDTPGNLLDQDKTVGALKLTEGQVVFVNPRCGVGGSQ